MIKGWMYRLIMRIAHRYNWHYAPPIYPDGDTQLWCQWCGFRATIKKGWDMGSKKGKKKCLNCGKYEEKKWYFNGLCSECLCEYEELKAIVENYE